MSIRGCQLLLSKLINELRECENGTVTTVSSLLTELGGVPEGLDEGQMPDLCRELEKSAGACGIVLDWKTSPENDIQPADEREFAVYNSFASVKCPRCGGQNTARLIYGDPSQCTEFRHRPEELRRRIKAGKIRLGSNAAGAESIVQVEGKPVEVRASRQCADCGKRFGAPPLIISRDQKTAKDYREEVAAVELVLREVFGSYIKIEIKRNDSGAEVRVTEKTDSLNLGLESSSQEPKEPGDQKMISREEWDSILDTLYTQLYLHEWRKGYDNRFVPDGPRWELKIRLRGRRQRNYHGSVSLTPYYKELQRLMLGVF